MVRNHNKPSIDYIKEALRYDPASGLLTWAYDTGPQKRVKAGSEAGALSPSDGYRYVRLMCPDGKKRTCSVHRVAFALMTGAWPVQEIDHINSVRTDNRWDNLRQVCTRQNAENKRKPRADSGTQVQGVNLLRSGRFRAQLRVCGKGRHIGVFATATEAHNAYLAAKRALHEGCTI